MIKNDEILVSISCLAFNHAPYIKKCMDGFIMQEVNFSFEVLIHDDASTDGTTDIIREYEKKYPNIIKPIYEEENQWQRGRRGSSIFNIPRAQGKYIAFCEGDDYWTYPLKLQKQVDYLETHPEYDMVCTRFQQLYQESGEIEDADLYNDIISEQSTGLELKHEHFLMYPLYLLPLHLLENLLSYYFLVIYYFLC